MNKELEKRFAAIPEKAKKILNFQDPEVFNFMKTHFMVQILRKHCKEIEAGYCSYKALDQCNNQ